MFQPTSRYYEIENATLTVTDASGSQRVIAYKRRRFIPPLVGDRTYRHPGRTARQHYRRLPGRSD